MALSADDIVLAQIELSEAGLRDLHIRRTQVQAALSAARETLACAQRDVELLSREDELLRTNQSTLSADVSARRTALQRARRDRTAQRVQRLLGNFPRELLQAIFFEAASVVHDVWREDARQWHVQDTHLICPYTPFALATVNRLWRDVAVTTGRLWTFLVVPELDDDRENSEFVDYVQTMLRRSKNHDINMLFCWYGSSWNDSRYYGQILDAVAKRVHHWRRVSIELPRDTPDSALAFLRMPMPRVEYLHIHADAGPHAPRSEVFPHCPRLQRLYDAVLPPPMHPLTELTHIYLIVPAYNLDTAWKTLAMLPAVQVLEMNILETVPHPSGAPAVTELIFPKLRCLGIYGSCLHIEAYASSLRAARLDELRVCQLMLPLVTVALVDEIVVPLTTLVIYDVDLAGILAESWHCVRRLQRLEHLILDTCKEPGRALPTLLQSRESAGLPRLRSITFQGPVLDDQQAHHVLAIMQSPHMRAGPAADGTISFTLDACADEVPDWLIRQYKCFCGDLSYEAEDEPSPRTASSASGADSAEAEFTDGGSGSTYTSDSDWEESSGSGSNNDGDSDTGNTER
ncbi:hypothetical protein AURDEDRAFT_112074 [Auricularia subglabra TFB-10046 SS5]|nr:hypothetical protein AURDEDRAFT_112074 [Auricularia subglabra TFB-10046 SS5]